MTPNTGQNSAARQTQGLQQQRPSFFNGFGGSIMRGLFIGGLIGMLLGYGFGGLAGMFGLILQVLLIGGVAFLLMRMFRSAQSSAPAMAGNAGNVGGFGRGGSSPGYSRDSGLFGMGGASSTPQDRHQPADSEEIALTQEDLDTFERRLTEVQEAFGREDHAALRRLVTPEMVSYLSEELADNARDGVRNDVSDVSLLQADIAESWREGDRDYATAAMRYAARDVKRDRVDGQIVEGDDRPTETTELWTFTRQGGTDWKLSAIQQVS
jgi:predicted lipid-binding transport protein (Tim44 family)